MRERAFNILPGHTLIKSDSRSKRLDKAVGILGKPPTPEFRSRLVGSWRRAIARLVVGVIA